MRIDNENEPELCETHHMPKRYYCESDHIQICVECWKHCHGNTEHHRVTLFTALVRQKSELQLRLLAQYRDVTQDMHRWNQIQLQGKFRHFLELVAKSEEIKDKIILARSEQELEESG